MFTGPIKATESNIVGSKECKLAASWGVGSLPGEGALGTNRLSKGGRAKTPVGGARRVCVGTTRLSLREGCVWDPVCVKGTAWKRLRGCWGQVWRWDVNLEVLRGQGDWGRGVSSLDARGGRAAGRGKGGAAASQVGWRQMRWEG